MANYSFYTSSHAKCILAGEHSVLRGYSALVVPVLKKTISLEYEKSSALEIFVDAENKKICEQNFIRLLLRSLTLLEKNPDELKGKFFLHNQIKMGAGLGFSAALAVAIARWLIWQEWIDADQLFPFARRLEDLFHGKSSGVDIAGVLTDKLIHFEIDGQTQNVPINWQPLFLLSYSGVTKMTKDHIQKVNELIKASPEVFQLIDDKMQNSVVNIEQALNQDQTALKKLSNAINDANQCFKDWQLITPQLQKHLDEVYQLGALAAKPTGGGGGGYVLSLWDKIPSQNMIEFIPISLAAEKAL